jgi:hypothetical protein
VVVAISQLQFFTGLLGEAGLDFFIGIRFTGEGILVIASHMSDTSKAAAVFSGSPFWLSALFPALISLVIPATAWGDIYKWTDEQGRTYYSDVPPPTSGKAKNVEVVQKEPKLTPAEQALLARIQSLERQVQAQRYAAQAPAAPPPTPYPSYYPSTPPPPPPSYYDSGYDSGYYGSYYPSYYPTYYYPAYSYPVYRARAIIARPVFAASHGGSFRGGGGHGGGHAGGHGGGHGGRR